MFDIVFELSMMNKFTNIDDMYSECKHMVYDFQMIHIWVIGFY